MSASSLKRTQLLKIATSLVKTHGFTREALARSVLYLPNQKHVESKQDNEDCQPLSDTAVSSLFGFGDAARTTLIHAWLDEGINHMSNSSQPARNVSDVLHTRLDWNEPVLGYLPEAFALLSTPNPSWLSLQFDPLPALKHAHRIADEAAYLSMDTSRELAWYARRISLAGIYSAAELHQLTSPSTAHSFLDSLLTGSSSLEQKLGDVMLYSDYVYKSWKGILKSRGML
ncbi:hypothetical protein BDP27DRAFT_1269660 [Rhodocollybia butyracea]|uniref:COQ9 C-terminal domain-containing protein n=1 Tax=Rhodocollybia butyracea TaxID=206335 RepID=A0A9P5PND1_9AGAR|nr:hypothetical protein BDP27DRAFT_1269660 [Rhodocollybia butyracea]